MKNCCCWRLSFFPSCAHVLVSDASFLAPCKIVIHRKGEGEKNEGKKSLFQSVAVVVVVFSSIYFCFFFSPSLEPETNHQTPAPIRNATAYPSLA